MYDYSKLLAKIIEQYHSRFQFALEVGLTAQTLNAKLNNKRSFTQREIEFIIKELNIDRSEIVDYFFTHKLA